MPLESHPLLVLPPGLRFLCFTAKAPPHPHCSISAVPSWNRVPDEMPEVRRLDRQKPREAAWLRAPGGRLVQSPSSQHSYSLTLNFWNVLTTVPSLVYLFIHSFIQARKHLNFFISLRCTKQNNRHLHKHLNFCSMLSSVLGVGNTR